MSKKPLDNDNMPNLIITYHRFYIGSNSSIFTELSYPKSGV